MINLNADDLAILDGLLLGDASVHPSRDIFSFAQAGAIREPFVRYVYDVLLRIGFNPRYNAVIRQSDGTFVATTWTESSQFWSSQRARFYPGRKKVIPIDIAVTSSSMLMEYLCDGSLGWAHNNPWAVGSSPWVELATCSYSLADIQRLGCVLMKEAQISRYSIKTPSKYPKLYIGGRENASAFFSFIIRGAKIPKGYEYKFRGFISD